MPNTRGLRLQGYKALSPMQQEQLQARFAGLRDAVHLRQRDLHALQAQAGTTESQYIQCRIDRDDLRKELVEVRQALRVSREHVARIKGVTDVSGLDVFAANARVSEQAQALAALREEVRWLRSAWI